MKFSYQILVSYYRASLLLLNQPTFCNSILCSQPLPRSPNPKPFKLALQRYPKPIQSFLPTMLFSVLTSLTLAATLAATMASAMPALNQRQTVVCSGTYSNAQCCATDVLGVADLNCFNREFCPSAPTSERDTNKTFQLHQLQPQQLTSYLSVPPMVNKPSVACCRFWDRLLFARTL